MPLLLGQLVYTSFPEMGYTALASAQVPTEIQQAFIQQVVYQYWDSYNPPKPGYRAAYLHQVTLEHNLFGWLYNDGPDDLDRSDSPYFVCYYLAELLHAVQLENIFTCLHRGPVALIDRQSLPTALETIVVTDLCSYQPARIGVAIPSGVRDRSHIELKHRRLLDLFIPGDEREVVTDTQELQDDPISGNTRNNLQRIQRILKLRKEDIAPIEAQIPRPRKAAQSLQRDAIATMAQVSSRTEKVKQVKPLNEAVVVNEAKTPALSGTAPSQGKRRSQMASIALLIGVSDYGPGFNELPRALKDVQAMQQILQHPEIGSFASVRTLLNPDRQVMEEAIETLFLERQPDEIVLLYFSGHGVKDDSGKLYLGTSITRKNVQEKLVKSSAVLVSFVQELIRDSRCKHQVVILDCCFSGTLTEGLSDKDDSSVDVLNQLGGEGRVILTSSTTTHCDFEQNELDLSIYTHYLVEGMETGAADLDNDGVISIKELHKYTSRQVQKAIPAMQPGIYGVGDYQQIILAKAPIDDPKRRYRREFERCANLGELSIVSRSILDVLRDTLGLLPEQSAAIEAGVLEPYHEYKKRLQRYVQEFVLAIHHKSLTSDHTRKRFKQLQLLLGLREEDVAPIEEQIARELKVLQSPDKVGGSSEVPITPVKLLNDAGAAREAESPTLTVTALTPAILDTEKSSSIGSSNSDHPNSVPANRNSRLLIGAGIAAAVLTLTGAIYELNQRQVSQPLKTIKDLIQERI